MLKKLLVFLKIVDEVQTPVPLQWKERFPVERKPEIKKAEIITSAEIVAKTPVNNLIKEKVVKEKSLILIERKRGISNKKKIENLSEFTKDYKEYCLEKTSNQHILKTLNYRIYDKNGVTETFIISQDAFITHNEHKTLRIESECFVKYIQQEYNPITRIIENAYD
ncbi:hypothetical protein GCM10023210_27620 [Chryseobacterium ginsengisoli]|uniref:Uncharacterized protein n=1 Tax=Chryseobacterium ginsengisoli TaxID=363853 RepID=A0ABP9MG33_9FLAO